jgi:single-stranded DNA-binding protein
MSQSDHNNCTILGTVAHISPLLTTKPGRPAVMTLHVLTMDDHFQNRHYITLWSRLATNMAPQLRVGDRVFVDGRLGSYTVDLGDRGFITRAHINARRVVIVGHVDGFTAEHEAADYDASDRDEPPTMNLIASAIDAQQQTR